MAAWSGSGKPTNFTQEPVKIIGEGANLDHLIDGVLMQRFGASPANASVEQIWIAHREVYKSLGREDWAKAIYEAYIQGRGIAY
jgi:hypothetical protein